jgi:hypothetical protein
MDRRDQERTSLRRQGAKGHWRRANDHSAEKFLSSGPVIHFFHPVLNPSAFRKPVAEDEPDRSW